jgi:histone H3/H4
MQTFTPTNKFAQAAGCHCYDPLVVDMLMQFSSQYIDDVAAEAYSYCLHANREQVDRSDLMLVLQSRADMMFTRPPPREVFSDIARSKNSERLRVLPETKEQQLPHIEHDCRMTIDCEYTVTADPDPRPTQMPSLRPSQAATAALKKAANDKLSTARVAAAVMSKGAAGNPSAAAAVRP